MFTSIPFLVYLVAFLLTIVSAVYPGRVPVWIPLLPVIVGLMVGAGRA